MVKKINKADTAAQYVIIKDPESKAMINVRKLGESKDYTLWRSDLDLVMAVRAKEILESLSTESYRRLMNYCTSEHFRGNFDALAEGRNYPKLPPRSGRPTSEPPLTPPLRRSARIAISQLQESDGVEEEEEEAEEEVDAEDIIDETQEWSASRWREAWIESR